MNAGRISGARAAMLREMGLGPLWRLRAADACELARIPSHTLPEPAGNLAVNAEVGTPDGVTRQPASQARSEFNSTASSAVTERASARPRMPAIEPAPAPAGPATVAKRIPADRQGGIRDDARALRIAGLDWAALEEDIRNCKACELYQRRQQAVPGVGDRNARWMLIGEGPGAEEDLRGEPFVGKAGQLLDNMLAAIGLKRGEDVYIGNAVKCRPPHNRTPEAGELACCRPYLERQIALVRPQLLIALGRPAAQVLLGSELSISAARGKVFQYGDTPVVVTYHPAYLLRNPQDKGKAWEDLCFARRLMNEKQN
jgi:uracil-DNA glycosylase